MPITTVSANLTAAGSCGELRIVHSQNEAMPAALSTESFACVRPFSMIGINAAAARKRLISGVAGGICLDMS